MIHTILRHLAAKGADPRSPPGSFAGQGFAAFGAHFSPDAVTLSPRSAHRMLC
ncbi:MAG: hypothetical protein LAO05_14195 [Acidobacteriia bacterium]|nr:hypothetical protein [Terriglobia bacterium]